MLLARLIGRGDKVDLIEGRVVITPVSSCPVCPNWLMENRDNLVEQMLRLAGTSGFQYTSYSTGNYGKKCGAGITLQFVNRLNDEAAYTVFNVELTRKRNSQHGKAGSALPVGQFRPPARGYFVPFWKRSGLALPPRLGSFHDYMGKLKPIIFEGQFSKGERLDSKSIQPLNISSALLERRLLADTNQTKPILNPDKRHTKEPYNNTPQPQIEQGLAPNQAAGQYNYGKRLSGNEVSRGSPSPLDYPKNQTTQQWLEAYGEDD